jgi:hypothetical protein
MTRAVLAAALVLGAAARPALAACDLSLVVGYQLVFGKVIEGYVEDGKRQHGFSGCTRDRVLVFADNTGVRCKETFVDHAENPKGYLFARSENDLKLCVGDEMYDVAPAR